MAASAYPYTIYSDYIDEDLTWFPVTLSMNTTAAPAGFWESLNALSADDDFTDVDDATPNERLWYTVDAAPTIESNKLRESVDSGNTRERLGSRFNLSGDFVIQLDYDLIAGPATNGWAGGLGVIVGSNAFYIYRAYRNGAHSYVTWETGQPWSATSFTSDTSGQLRITRTGTLADAYYYDSGWVYLRSFTTGSGDATIRIDTDTFTGFPTATLDYDNFTVVSADGITWNHLSDRVYFEDSDSNRLYAEIETFDTATSAATYHFAVPTIPSGADTPITMNWNWEGRDYSVRELPATYVSDDFTGANGSVPDTTKWEFVGATTSIQSNKLNMPLAQGAGNANTQAYWINDTIVGNFDIQVDYDLVTYPNSSFWGAQFVISDVDGEGCSLVRGWYGSQAYRTWENNAGWQTNTGTGDTSGKLRIARVGTTWTTYTWNGSSWDTNHTWDPGTAGDLNIIYLTLRHGDGNPACECNWDNFQFNHSQYVPDEVNDDFTGTNGNAPDPLKWSITSGTPEIQGNSLRLHNTEVLQTKYLIDENFDVQVDWTGVVAPDTNSYWWALRVFYDSDNYLDMAKGYWGGAEKFANEGYNGGAYFIDADGTTDGSGKFRITRNGSTWDAYRWAGSSWTQSGLSEANQTGMPTGPVYIILYTSRWDSAPTIDVDFDNFQINGADSITGWTHTVGNVPSQQVWDSNFKIVTHLAQTPTGSANDIKDSTSNENHGTSYNMDSSNSSTNDIGCKSLTFDGVEEWVDYGDILDPGTGEYSVELCVKGNTNETLEMIIAKGNRGSGDAGWSIWQAEANLRTRCGAGGLVERAGSSLAYGDLDPIWYSVALVLDHTDEKIYGYRDGSKSDWYQGGGGPTSDDITGFDIDTSDELTVATARQNGVNYIYGKFEFSEIRISNTARTPAWIAATNYSFTGDIWTPVAATEWTLTVQELTSLTSTQNINFYDWLLSMQDLTVSTSISTDMLIVVWLIMQSINVNTSMDDFMLQLQLLINDLNIDVNLNQMQFWRALKTINNTVEFRTLMRTLVSKSLDRTLDSKTIERTLKQIKQLGHFYDNP